MRGKLIALLFTFSLLLGIIAVAGSTEVYAAGPHGAKFEPPAGKTLFIAGQEAKSIGGLDNYTNGYTDTVGVVPGGATAYVITKPGRNIWGWNTVGLDGLESTANWGSNDCNAQSIMSDPTYSNSVLHLSIDMVDDEANIANGTRDGLIDHLAQWVKNQDRPVFLRIGYEFDGSWNHYDPTNYINAFRRIVDRFRAAGVDNFATVWASFGSIGTGIENWYPGDSYVDWYGISDFGYFQGGDMLVWARQHNKPLMIAESAPKDWRLDTDDGATVWNEWFVPYFNFIHNNSDIIKAVCYINSDWWTQPMWNPFWGDSRIQTNNYVKAQWLNEIQSSLWLNSSSTLFSTLGYTKRNIPPAPTPTPLPLGKVEAESCIKLNNAINYSDPGASGGSVVGYIEGYLDGIMINNAPACNSITIRYSSPYSGIQDLWVNDVLVQKVNFPSTGSYYTYSDITVPVNIPVNSSIRLYWRDYDTSWNIDCVTFTQEGGQETKIEAESGTKYNGAGNYPDAAASGGQIVAYLGEVGSAVEFNNVPAGNTLTLKYATINTGTLSLYINGIHTRDISFTPNGVWTGTYATKVESISIPAGATVKLQNDSGDTYGVNIDYIQIN
jgi:Glycosyl hydrolase family 26